MVMGIPIENFNPAASTVLREVRYKKVNFALFFAVFREIHHDGDTY
jgi:hypothetical protein